MPTNKVVDFVHELWSNIFMKCWSWSYVGCIVILHDAFYSLYLVRKRSRKWPLVSFKESFRGECNPPWGGLLYEKDRDAPCKFWKEPLRATKILFCGCGLKFFSTLWGTNKKKKHINWHWLFSAQYPKRYSKSLCCGPFEPEHPER